MRHEEELRFVILAAQREGARALREMLEPHGITPAQAEALRCLGDAGVPLTLTGLGTRLVCESGSPSRLASILVESGWVRREDNPANRREVLLTLTEEGRSLENQVRAVEARLYSGISEILSELAQRGIIAALRPLVGAVGAAAIERRREDQTARISTPPAS